VKRLLEFLDDRQHRRKPAVVATIVRADVSASYAVGDRIFFDADNLTCMANATTPDLLSDAARAAFYERQSRLMHLDDVDVFVEWVGAPQRLLCSVLAMTPYLW